MGDRLIYLYVKESPLGLKYLGHSLSDPTKDYMGSGVVWRNHLKKHRFTNKHLKTEIIFSSYNRKEVGKKGIYYSKLWNIVRDENWANLMEETAEKGGTGCIKSDETKRRISEAKKGHKMPEYSTRRKYKAVRHKETGKIYENVKSAAIDNNMTYRALCCSLASSPFCKFEYVEEKYRKIILPKKKGPHKVVKHIETGVIYNSVGEACEKIGLSYNDMYYKLTIHGIPTFEYITNY